MRTGSGRRIYRAVAGGACDYRDISERESFATLRSSFLILSPPAVAGDHFQVAPQEIILPKLDDDFIRDDVLLRKVRLKLVGLSDYAGGGT
jgi:hypothetical protein